MTAWTGFLSAMVLTLVRVSGMVVFAPFFSSAALPVRTKAVFVGAVAYLLAPMVASLPAAHVEITFASLLGEIAVGLVYGLVLSLLNEMLLFAGQIAGVQFSFSMVNLLDPTSNIQTPLMGDLFQLMGTLVLIAAGLDRILLASLVRSFHWSLISGLIANAIAFAICVPLLARYRNVKMPPVTRRWYDIPLRASLVATLVAIVVTSSGWVGPKISGIIALFPAVFTSMMLILHPRIGGKPTAAVIANSAWGLIGLGLAIAVLHVTAVPLGSAIGLSLALATCFSWNLTLWWNGRRKAAR